MIKNSGIRKILFNPTNTDNNSAYLSNSALYISLLITLIFSIMYFNVGINTGGDDVGYVLRARRLWEKGIFPTFQGPLYPVFLAPFYGLAKGNLIILRMISIPMFLGSILFIFKTFKSILPPRPFFILLLILSINFYWLTYSSLTYSEALYNFIQFGVFYFFYRRFIDSEAKIKDIILLAFLGILLMKTRAIGATIIATIVIYFLIRKHWEKLIQFSLISLLFIIIWDSITYFLLGDNNSILISQITGLLQENPYDPTRGLTDFKLLIERFFYNYNEYVSVHILQLLGIRGTGMIEANWIFTVFISLFILVVIFFNRGRNNMIRFALIYLLLGMLVVFMTPKMWSQMRFIQPHIPIIYIVLLNEFQMLSKKRLSWLPAVMLSLLFILQLGHSVHYIKDNNNKIEAYMQGDKYFDQTPDWKNYLMTCEWIGENLTEEEGRIACRKPQIAAIVSGQDNFFGLYYLPTYRFSKLSNKLSDKNENFIAIDIERFYRHPVPDRITMAMMHGFAGPIWKNSGNTNLRLFQIEEEEIFDKIVSVNDALNFIVPIQTLLDDDDYTVSLADSLLLRLKQNNVAYIMRANLRVYEAEKTEEVLSSVHHYMSTINIKYPNIFEPVFQSGSEFDEPATIFKIHYPGDRVTPEQDKEKPAISAKDNFKRMCEWAVNNTLQEHYILCGSNDSAFNEKVPERLLILNSIPTMNYAEFINRYLPEKDKYLILNHVKFDSENIDNSLITELNKSSHGLIYIGNTILTLHKIGSPRIYNRLIEDENLRNYVAKIESIANLPEDAEESFRFFEPTYILTKLFNRNIHYIIVDNIAPANTQNYIKELISFINTKFPDAFHEVKSIGVKGPDKATLYKINFQVLN